MTFLEKLNFFALLENVYYDTTDPESKFTRLLSLDVAFSILLHSALYTLVVYVVKERIKLAPHLKSGLSFYQKLFYSLVIIMSIGYVLRLLRVKAMYNTIQKNESGWWKLYSTAKKETRIATDNAYKVWYFLG